MTKEKYENILKTLISLNILSETSKNNYGVEVPGGDLYFKIENKTLYFVNSKDAINVKNNFVNSTTVYHT
jgi:hypothetical protein